jgi:hypothetical protein
VSELPLAPGERVLGTWRPPLLGRWLVPPGLLAGGALLAAVACPLAIAAARADDRFVPLGLTAGVALVAWGALTVLALAMRLGVGALVPGLLIGGGAAVRWASLVATVGYDEALARTTAHEEQAFAVAAALALGLGLALVDRRERRVVLTDQQLLLVAGHRCLWRRRLDAPLRLQARGDRALLVVGHHRVELLRDDAEHAVAELARAREARG